jgi:hypothetical protein
MKTTKKITMYIIIYVILLILILSNIKEKTAIFSVLSLILILKSDIKINNMIMFIAFYMFVIQSLGLIQPNNVYEGFPNNNPDNKILMTGEIPEYVCNIDDKESNKCNTIVIEDVPTRIIHKDNYNYHIMEYIDELASANEGYFVNFIELWDNITSDEKQMDLPSGQEGAYFEPLLEAAIYPAFVDNRSKIKVLNKLTNYLDNNQIKAEGFKEGSGPSSSYQTRKARRRALRQKRKHAMKTAGYDGNGGVSESLFYHVESDEKRGLQEEGNYSGGLFCQHIDLTKDNLIKLMGKDITYIVNYLVNSIDDNNLDNPDNLSKFFTYGTESKPDKLDKLVAPRSAVSFRTPETIVHRIDFKSSYKQHEMHSMVSGPLNLKTSMPWRSGGSVTSKTKDDYYALLYTGGFVRQASAQVKLRLTSNYYSYLIISDDDPWQVNDKIVFNSDDDALTNRNRNRVGDDALTNRIKVGNSYVNGKVIAKELTVAAQPGLPGKVVTTYITIVYLVKTGGENLKLEWQTGLGGWKNVLTSLNSNIFNTTRSDVVFFYNTKYFNKLTRINTGPTDAVMFLSKNIDYDFNAEDTLTPIVEKFEGFKDGYVDYTQCARRRLKMPHNSKCNFVHTHEWNIRTLKKRVLEIKELIYILLDEVEKKIYGQIIEARKEYAIGCWVLQLKTEINRLYEIAPLEDLDCLNIALLESDVYNTVKYDETWLNQYALFKNWYNKEHEMKLTFDSALGNGMERHTTEIILNDREIQRTHKHIRDDSLYLDDKIELQKFKDSITFMSGKFSNKIDGISDVSVDIVGNDIYDKISCQMRVLKALDESAEKKEGFIEGNNTDQYTEKYAINSLNECLLNKSTLEDIIICFKNKIGHEDSWFKNNNVVTTTNGYEFNGDANYLSNNMQVILLEYILPFINTYDKLVTFVQRVEQAYHNYIKNGPNGLVKLFNLESNATNDNISYDYISQNLKQFNNITILDNNYSVDNDIVKKLQNKLKEDKYYKDFDDLKLYDIKTRVDIITESELNNISQHYKGRNTDNICTLPSSILDICNTNNHCVDPRNIDGKPSACCFDPDNYPPAKLYLSNN